MTNDAKANQIIEQFHKQSPDPGALKPVSTVAKLNTIAQDIFPNEKDIIQLVQDAYMKMLLTRGLDLNQARQSWVTASGGNFEAYLRNHI